MNAVAAAIKLVLNHVPRSCVQRMAGWIVPIAGLLYRGKGRVCPICGTRLRKFMPYGYGPVRDDALCPNCLSLERHRQLWLYLKEQTSLFTEYPVLLHIAPEVCLMRHLRRHYSKANCERYVTADLESPLADLHFDVQQIPLADNSVDAIICNHLLEHVEDDRKALRELHRILRPGGWAVIMVPEQKDRKVTFEDDSITDPKERATVFGQYDHRRIYGADYTQRVAAQGFQVESIDYFKTKENSSRKEYSLGHDTIYIAYKLR